jgi:hypothetical protein
MVKKMNRASKNRENMVKKMNRANKDRENTIEMAYYRIFALTRVAITL